MVYNRIYKRLSYDKKHKNIDKRNTHLNGIQKPMFCCWTSPLEIFRLQRLKYEIFNAQRHYSWKFMLTSRVNDPNFGHAWIIKPSIPSVLRLSTALAKTQCLVNDTLGIHGEHCRSVKVS